MKKSSLVVLVLSSFSLVACGAPGKPAATIAKRSIDAIGCKVARSEMWNSLHQVAEEAGTFPSAADLRQALLDTGAERGLSGPEFNAYVNDFVAHYSLTIEGIKARFAPVDLKDWQKRLAEMEVGIRVTEVHAELQGKISDSLTQLAASEKNLSVKCATPEPEPQPEPATTPAPAPAGPPGTPVAQSPKTIWEQLEASENPEVVGARRTLATLYQSCDALTAPAMTASTPSLEGIRILSERHPAGGLKRVYDSLASINSSHYYIKNRALAKAGCFEVRNSPPIYDFGGKPFTSASQPHLLNMFKDGGSGTEVLGIDCSAYVFSALALAGLKMDPDPSKVLEAKLVHGIPSTAFKEPQSNGLRCLAKIKVTGDSSIEPGDIVAIKGHVVMIDEVGKDPFGLDAITSAADCNSSKISYQKFAFVVAQSSPSKNGIGVNRYQARNYLAESGTYRTGLTGYAIAACRAKFGLSTTVDTASLAVVRHKRTPECLAPAPLVSHKQDCVDSCRPI